MRVYMIILLFHQGLFILTEAMPDEKQPGKPMRVFFQDQQESREWKRLSEIAQKVHHAAATIATVAGHFHPKVFVNCSTAQDV